MTDMISFIENTGNEIIDQLQEETQALIDSGMEMQTACETMRGLVEGTFMEALMDQVIDDAFEDFDWE